MKTLPPLAIVLVALACVPALASTHANQSSKHATKNKSDEKAPNLAEMHATPYDCDLGDKLIVYRKPGDDRRIALQWKKRTHHLVRIKTSTGADRFENSETGLVWIGIPAKSMLLDSKKGRQLANGCRNAEQKKFVQK
jgi:hypothetical protein